MDGRAATHARYDCSLKQSMNDGGDTCHRVRLRALVATAVMLVLSACDESITAPTRSDLTGHWRLVSLHPRNGASITPRAGTNPGIDLIGDRISVQSDCNVCSGQYTHSESSFRLSVLACTRRACTVESIEGPYLQILSTTSTAGIVAGRALTLEGPEGRLVFQR